MSGPCCFFQASIKLMYASSFILNCLRVLKLSIKPADVSLFSSPSCAPHLLLSCVFPSCKLTVFVFFACLRCFLFVFSFVPGAGRDGRPAAALLYYSQDDVRRAQFLARQEQPYGDNKNNKDADEEGGGGFKPPSTRDGVYSSGSVEHRLQLLESQVEYCDAVTCRRALLLKYFGERLADTPELRASRAEKRCCDVCADAKRAEQALLLAKSLGARAAAGGAGASLAPLRGAAFDGPKSGESGSSSSRFGPDEYEEAYEETPLQKARAAEAASARREAAGAESLLLPRHLATDKSARSVDKLLAHLEAAEKRAERAQGVERRTKLVPFASLKQQTNNATAGGGVAGQKRARPYHGPLLGVDDGGSHLIKDLATSKREQCLETLEKQVKNNFALPSVLLSESEATFSAHHSAASVAAALEWRLFRGNHSAAAYTTALRSLCMDVSAATRNKQRFNGAESIDFAALPKRSSGSSSASSSSSSAGSSEDDDDASSDSSDDDAGPATKRAKTSSSSTAAGARPSAGGFISASSLKTAAGGTLATHKPLPSPAGGSAGAVGAFQSAASAMKTQQQPQPRPAASMGFSSASSLAASSSVSMSTSSSSSSSSVTPSSQLPATTAPAKKQSPLRNYFGPITASLPRTPPRSSGKPKPTLALSYVGATTNNNKPAVSPSRIAPLPLTNSGSASGAAAAAASSSPSKPSNEPGGARKKPRLELTSSPLGGGCAALAARVNFFEPHMTHQ